LVLLRFHLRQEAGKFVAHEKQTIEVLIQQYAKLLNSGVIVGKARLRWFRAIIIHLLFYYSPGLVMIALAERGCRLLVRVLATKLL